MAKLSKFYSIDPGDVHVGVALFKGQRCMWAREFTPEGILKYLADHLNGSEALVVERFQLYPHLAQKQSGSDMLTSQLIGALRLLACQKGVPVVIQQAALKTPAESAIIKRNVPRQSTGNGDHAKDAETHGYAYIWRGRLEGAQKNG